MRPPVLSVVPAQTQASSPDRAHPASAAGWRGLCRPQHSLWAAPALWPSTLEPCPISSSVDSGSAWASSLARAQALLQAAS